jgi:hypothetical protein
MWNCELSFFGGRESGESEKAGKTLNLIIGLALYQLESGGVRKTVVCATTFLEAIAVV